MVGGSGRWVLMLSAEDLVHCLRGFIRVHPLQPCLVDVGFGLLQPGNLVGASFNGSASISELHGICSAI